MALTQTNRRKFPLKNKADDQTQSRPSESSNQTVPTIQIGPVETHQVPELREPTVCSNYGPGCRLTRREEKGTKWNERLGRGDWKQTSNRIKGYLWLQLMVSTCICSCQNVNALKPAGRTRIYCTSVLPTWMNTLIVLFSNFFNIIRDKINFPETSVGEATLKLYSKASIEKKLQN